jgi:hypothetical protein
MEAVEQSTFTDDGRFFMADFTYQPSAFAGQRRALEGGGLVWFYEAVRSRPAFADSIAAAGGEQDRMRRASSASATPSIPPGVAMSQNNNSTFSARRSISRAESARCASFT